jgi:hypothetical protein
VKLLRRAAALTDEAQPVARTVQLILLRCRRGMTSGPARWALPGASGAGAIGGGFLVARHFTNMSWPLSGGGPGMLVAAGLLLLVAQALKAIGWARLFAPAEDRIRSRSQPATAAPR